MFLIGWVIGMILMRVIEEVVKILKIDEALKAAGLNETARRAGFNLDIGRFFGSLVMWSESNLK